MKYPKPNVLIYIFLDNGNRTKGMFYWNGSKPTFVSYGTEITDRVSRWEYPAEKERKAQ